MGLVALGSLASASAIASEGRADEASHEEVSMPAGKTLSANREVNRAKVRMISCPIDSSKALGCHTRQDALRRAQREVVIEDN